MTVITMLYNKCIYLFAVIDVSISTASSSTNILRSAPGPYTISVTFSHFAGDYNIVPTDGTDKNYLLYYFLSPDEITSGVAANNRSDMNEITLSSSMSQGRLDMSQSNAYVAEAVVDIMLEECESMHFLCFLVTDMPGASYKEEDFENNVYCADFDAVKNCTPGIPFTSFVKYLR